MNIFINKCAHSLFIVTLNTEVNGKTAGISELSITSWVSTVEGCL